MADIFNFADPESALIRSTGTLTDETAGAGGVISVEADGSLAATAGTVAVSAVTLTRTNAQIIALTSGNAHVAGATLVAAPGATAMIAPFLVVVTKSFAVGYSSIGAAGSVGVYVTYDNGGPFGTNRSAAYILESDYGILSATGAEQYVLPPGTVDGNNGSVFPPVSADYRNLRLIVWIDNTTTGTQAPLTGGDAANVLTVTVYYQTITGLV